MPVLIDKVDLPLGFGETQALPLTGWRGDRSDARYQAVLDGVRLKVGAPTGAEKPLAPAAKVDRRVIIGGGAAAGVALAGVGAWSLLHDRANSTSKSIAVLPFANLSGDPLQAYFTDGITEEIRSALARIPGLTVIGRTSCEAVRKDDAKTAAAKLGVGNILTGSVRQSASALRITAELVDGLSGADKWSQDYDRTPGDVIKIQTDIAENLVRALRGAMGDAFKTAIKLGGTTNPEAQRLVHEAAATSRKVDNASNQQTVALLRQAIGLDPNYANAYVRMSGALERLAWDEGAFDTRLAEALGFADKAVQIAPTYEGGYRARSRIYKDRLQWRPALENAQTAIQLAPNYPTTLVEYAYILGTLDRRNEAIAAATKAVAGDPLNAFNYSCRATILYYAGQVPEMISYSEEIRRKSPKLFNWGTLLCYAYLVVGRDKDAKALLDLMPATSGTVMFAHGIQAAHARDNAAVDATLATIKAKAPRGYSYISAQIEAQAGRKDQAFAHLEEAIRAALPSVQDIQNDPMLDPLRSDPRMAKLIHQVFGSAV